MLWKTVRRATKNKGDDWRVGAFPGLRAQSRTSREQRNKGSEPECPQLYGIWPATWGRMATLPLDRGSAGRDRLAKGLLSLLFHQEAHRWGPGHLPPSSSGESTSRWARRE